VRRELLTRNLLEPLEEDCRHGRSCRHADARCPMQAIGWLRGHDWSTFGPHHIGTERLLAVSNAPSLVQVATVILEKHTRRRTLMRMRPQVQGRPAGTSDPATT
jgi:hypothetical protein